MSARTKRGTFRALGTRISIAISQVRKQGSTDGTRCPTQRTLARALGRLGIANGIQVVAYDQDNGMFASRLWWLLRWLGHDDVAVLDGGFAKWTAEGRVTATGRERRQERRFAGAPKSDMTVQASDVAQIFRNPDWRLLDARAPERFRGDVEPIDKVPGHIPGAANHFFKSNVAEDGTFKSTQELSLGVATRSVSGVPIDHLVCYCGIRRDRLPQSPGARTCRLPRREAVCGIMERMVV